MMPLLAQTGWERWTWHPWSPFSSSAMWIVPVVALALFAAWHNLRAASNVRRRWTGFLLRVATVATLAVLLTGPVRERHSTSATQRRVAVFVDTSASMAIVDPEAGGRSRLQQGLDLLNDPTWRTALSDAEVDWYTFDEVVRDVGPEAESSFAADLEQVDPRGTSTSLTAALTRAVQIARDDDLAAAILISDGRATTPGDSSREAIDLARDLASSGAQLIPIGVGTEASRWLRLDSAVVPPVTFLGDELAIPVTVSQRGLAGADAVVTLHAGDSELARTTLRLDGLTNRTTLRAPLEEAGWVELETRLEIPVEARNDRTLRTGATTRVSATNVIDDGIGILALHAQPHFEWRFVRDAMLGERRFRDRWSSPLLATASEVDLDALLEEADVVWLGDVAQPGLPREWLEALATAVRERGVGLLVSASRAPSDAPSPIEALLPVHLTAARYESTEPTIPAIPRLASDHPAIASWTTELAPFELPPVHSVLRGVRARELATVTLELDPATPAWVSRPAGRGRVTFAALDSTWRWRRVRGGEVFDRFWRQWFLWLAEPRLSSRDGLDLELLPARPRRGERVVVSAALPLDRPAPRAVFTQLDRAAPERHELRASQRRPGRFEMAFHPAAEGHYRIWLDLEDGSGPVRHLEVRGPRGELDDAQLDSAFLRELAAAAGGAWVPRQSAELPASLDLAPRPQAERTYTSLASLHRPGWAIGLIALLVAEWAWRRLRHLR